MPHPTNALRVVAAALCAGLWICQPLSATDGSVPLGSSPEQFGAHIKSEIAKWQKLVKEAGLALH